MQLSHSRRVVLARFDEPNLVSCAGLVPVMRLAQDAGLGDLADRWLMVPTDKGANAGLKVSSLVAGMAAGADSIDDLNLLRHGGMGQVFTGVYAPSTLGSFLRAFTIGHVRQLDAVASRFLAGLAAGTPVLAGIDGPDVMIDIDDTVKEVYGHAKQGVEVGYTRTRGLDALLTTVSTPHAAPVITGQRLRRGAAASQRGAASMITQAARLVGRMRSTDVIGTPLVRMDSAFYGYPAVAAAVDAGADVSVTVKLDTKVRKAIATIPADGWTTIEYPHPVPDPDTGTLISRAELAEIEFTAFTGPSQRQRRPIPGRLVVRRIPDLAPRHVAAGQDPLFSVWRFHPLFTTTSTQHRDTVAADQVHRRHAIIEQIIRDLKNSALAHLPSGSYTANAAWLVCAVMAFNLTRAAATITGPTLARAATATIRRTLITVPARIVRSARRTTLRLPAHWPWHEPWTTLFTAGCGPPAIATT